MQDDSFPRGGPRPRGPLSARQGPGGVPRGLEVRCWMDLPSLSETDRRAFDSVGAVIPVYKVRCPLCGKGLSSKGWEVCWRIRVHPSYLAPCIRVVGMPLACHILDLCSCCVGRGFLSRPPPTTRRPNSMPWPECGSISSLSPRTLPLILTCMTCLSQYCRALGTLFCFRSCHLLVVSPVGGFVPRAHH